MEAVYWIMWGMVCSFYVGVWLLTSGCERRFVADPHRYAPNCTTVAVRRPVPAPRVESARPAGLKRPVIVRLIAAGILASLLVASVVIPAAASSGASVSVGVTVRHALTVTFTDAGVLVSTNGPWTLSAELPGGDRFVTSGDAGARQLVVLPAGATAVDVFPR